MNELSLFTGAGGGVLGSKLLGWTTIGYVEINDYCQRVLAQRIKDGLLNEAPIFGDIRSFISEGYAGSYRGMVDVVTAGFPCQPFSVAGKSEGEFDPRNMWPETIECIRRIRPRFALLENVPGLLAHAYFGAILGDLAESGYCVGWRCLSAGELGAPHYRDRLWIVGFNPDEMYAFGVGEPSREDKNSSEWAAEENKQRRYGWQFELGATHVAQRISSYTDAMRVLHGMADRLDRLEALGNGQVPIVAKSAWEILSSSQSFYGPGHRKSLEALAAASTAGSRKG